MKIMTDSASHLMMFTQWNPDQLQLGFLKVLKGSRMQEEAEQYGIVHKEREPYEVLSTRWLSLQRDPETEDDGETWWKSTITVVSLDIR